MKVYLGKPSDNVVQWIINERLSNEKVQLKIETTSEYNKSGIYSATRYDSNKPMTIDWGDGTIEQIDGDISQKVHEYAVAGQYEVAVKNIKTFAASTNNYNWYSTTSQNAYTLKEVVEMPKSVTSISNNAFYGCSSLSSIQLPASLISIGDSAFAICTSLSSIKIPDSATSIGNQAFYSCISLSSITIGNSVASIGEYAFYNCSSLSSIQIPDSMTSIGEWAFSSCFSLSNITCNRMSAPTVQNSTFGDSTRSYTGRNTYDQGINRLYVPTGATGYDSSYWADPLQNASKCGFTLEYI